MTDHSRAVPNGLKKIMPETCNTNQDGQFEIPLYTRGGAYVATVAVLPFLTFDGVSIIQEGRVFAFDTESRRFLECCPVVAVRTVAESLAAQGGTA